MNNKLNKDQPKKFFSLIQHVVCGTEFKYSQQKTHLKAFCLTLVRRFSTFTSSVGQKA